MNMIISTWDSIISTLKIVLAFALVPSLVILGWYVYYRAIPKILKYFASLQKFIGTIPEFSWAAITVSGVFKYGRINKAGFKLSSNDHSAQINPGVDPVSTQWLKGWLHRRGFVWLGFDAPNITRFAEKEIDAVKMNPDRKESDPLEKWITSRKKKINNLYLSFPMYVLVENIDTTDTKKVEVLVMAEVEVVIPYLTWYGQGGKAYSVIRTRVEKRVRAEFEKYSLLQLIQDEKSQDDAEKELVNGVPNCLDLGVKVNTVTIVEWDWKADEAFMKLLEDPKAIEAREKAILREQDLQKAEALKELTILQAKIDAAKATKKLSAAQWSSVLARFGGDIELAKTSMIKGDLTTEEFEALQLATALAKTGVTAIGDGFMAMIKPKKQPTKE